MEIINRYFNFKKDNLLKYTEIFFDNASNAKNYLASFIETYINTYYFHILDTHYDEEPSIYDDKVIIKEIKGKRIELIEDLNKLEDAREKKKELDLIDQCYKYCFISIIIDLTSFTYCNKLSEFRDHIRKILMDNKNLIEENDEILEKLSVLVKDNITKERKFFIGLRNDTFSINYYSYLSSRENFLVELNYKILQLERNYSQRVLDKNYKSEKLSLEKVIATSNLVQIDLLNRIIRNKPIHHYFIEMPLDHIHKKEDLEKIVKAYDNPRTKDKVVFIINYNDYTSNKSLFKNLKEFKFALLVDLSRTIVMDKKLAEIDSYDVFSYVIINGLKKEDSQLVENYVMKGKEMFMNELNMM